MEKKEIGEILKKIRLESGKTQKDVAALIGRTQQIIGHWETGYSQPDANTLFDLCRIYGTTVDEAFGFSKNKNPKKISFLPDTAEVAIAYESSDITVKNCVRAILDLPKIDLECERIQSGQKEYIEMAARGGKIRIEKDKAIELAKIAKAAPNSANRKDLF